MGKFAVITENDESAWRDETGVLYHFPKRYISYLLPGTQVVYYKGKLRKALYASERGSESPHYFALAKIGNVWLDTGSSKGDHFAQIAEFQRFQKPVLAKDGEDYLETIPENRQSNYWRDGVRPVSQEVYDRIVSHAIVLSPSQQTWSSDDLQGTEAALESAVDGAVRQRFVTTYERRPENRRAAIALHGTRCCICSFDFAVTYGEEGAGYIHIHHLSPVSEMGGPSAVNPATELVPVCANCHAIIHRRKDRTLSIQEMKDLIQANRQNAMGSTSEGTVRLT